MEYVLLVILGLVAGVLGGLLGVGGSVLMIPGMVAIFAISEPGPPKIQQYQAAAMIVNFLLIAPSVLRHARAKAILFDVWKWLAPTALVGIVVGVAASRLPIFTGANQGIMKMTFGAFLLYVALYNLYRLRPAADDSRERLAPVTPAWWKTLCVGLPIGFSSGLLGIGGGALAVPAQQVVLGLPLRNSIATSAATILTISWLGAITKNASLGADGTVLRSIELAAVLTPTAMIGSYLGGHLTHTLPLRVVRIAFAGLMLASAAKMFGWL